jgi:GDP-L-fucose synthase
LIKILITGGNGFLGKELFNFFKDKYYVVSSSRNSSTSLDLLNKESINNFFSKYGYFDYVLHTAINGAKNPNKEDFKILIDNLSMFGNLLEFKKYYGKIFNFCSGAALKTESGTDNVKEEDILKTYPKNYYGLSKNIIARNCLTLNFVNNFRIFGCFGIYEDDTRFIKSSLQKIKNNQQPVIHSDRKMDFFYSKDVGNVIEYYILNEQKHLYKDLNLVYKQKYSLSDILGTIKNITNYDGENIVFNKNIDVPYTGDGSKLESLPIQLIGLNGGIAEIKEYVFGN